MNLITETCIYCPGTVDRTSDDEYHIIPFSLGNTSDDQRLRIISPYTLPKGIVCKSCNSYFGSHLDTHLVNHPVLRMWKTLKSIPSYNSSTPVFENETVRLSSRKNKLLSIDKGEGRIVLKNDGTLSIPHASLKNLKHTQVSRALHKIAFECSIWQMLKDTNIDIEKTKSHHSSNLFSEIRRYIRAPKKNDYRPYGMMRTGDAGIALTPLYFKKGDKNIVGPEFLACAINFAGARFLCTLSESPQDAIKFVLLKLKEYGLFAWMGTGEIFWNAKGEMIWKE